NQPPLLVAKLNDAISPAVRVTCSTGPLGNATVNVLPDVCVIRLDISAGFTFTNPSTPESQKQLPGSPCCIELRTGPLLVPYKLIFALLVFALDDAIWLIACIMPCSKA